MGASCQLLEDSNSLSPVWIAQVPKLVTSLRMICRVRLLEDGVRKTMAVEGPDTPWQFQSDSYRHSCDKSTAIPLVLVRVTNATARHGPCSYASSL